MKTKYNASDYDLPEHVACPFCNGLDTELHSPFGPQLSVASYWCNRCHTAFDWIKWKATTRTGGDSR
jgi:hypothetical protein